MPLRVLHVIPAVAPRYGGPSVAAVGICRALRAAGLETIIATTDADGRGRLPVTVGASTSYQGVPTMFFPRQASESFKYSAPLSEWLTGHVAEFDLVHVHAVFSHSSLAAGRACRTAGVPFMVRPLGTLDPWSLDRHPRRKRLLLALGGRRFLSSAAAVHYTTSEEQRLAELRLPWLPRGVVIPLGVDDGLFASPGERTSGPPILLSVGRLHAKKGIQILIDSVHDLAAAGKLGPWRLVIAGDGEPAYVRGLEHRAAAGPAREHIEFRGWVDAAARARLLQRSHLFALPSYQENFGIALVEAMASGVPAVVTPGVNLAAEIALAEAGWVSASSREALTAALADAIGSAEERARRGARARAFAARYRWQIVADELVVAYHDAIRGHGAPAGAHGPQLREMPASDEVS